MDETQICRNIDISKAKASALGGSFCFSNFISYNAIMKKTYKILILLIFILELTIAINKFSADDFIKNTFYKIFTPFQKSTWQAGGWFSDKLIAPLTVEKIQTENQNLVKENLSLKEQIIILKSQAEENAILKAALGISAERKENMVLADALNKDFLGNYLLVNKGSKDKITKGLAVITPDGALVGKVEKVYNDFSQIILITSASSSFSAEIENEKTGVLAVIKGNGDGKVFFELVPQEQVLSKGDLVKTIALGNIFPKDILVGEVLNFEKEPSSSFQKGDILPYFLRNNFKQLLIIVDEK